MTPRRLTIATAKDLPFEDLIEQAHGLIEPYAVPTEGEANAARLTRLERALDELPDIYSWLQQLESYFDHWTDFNASQHGIKSLEYKSMRERRDAMERAASAAKLRYEGASRVLTRIMNFDPQGMPRSRSEPS